MRVCRKLLMGDSYHGNFRHWWQASGGDIFGQLCFSMPHKSGGLGSFLISLLAVPVLFTHSIVSVSYPLRSLRSKEKDKKQWHWERKALRTLTYPLSEIRIHATNNCLHRLHIFLSHSCKWEVKSRITFSLIHMGRKIEKMYTICITANRIP